MKRITRSRILWIPRIFTFFRWSIQMVGNSFMANCFAPAQVLTHTPGFVYTQTTDRLWRKNRQPVSGTTCPGGSGSGDGRDIARNWPYQWDVPIGASTDPCDEKFKGFCSRPSKAPTPLYICPNHSSHT